MTATKPPTPDDDSSPEIEESLLAAAGDAPPEIDLSKERLFENEPPAEETADLPAPERPVGPIFRASLSDAVWLLWRRVSGNPVEELGCRHCGYPARQLTKRACPECGADFMREGLISPTDTRLGLVALALGWTLAILIAAIATRSKLPQFILPAQFHRYASLTFVERGPGESAHRLTLSGEFNSNDRWPDDKAALDDSIKQMVVYLAPKESSPIACDLDLVKSTYSFRDGSKPIFSGYPSKGRLDDDAIATLILFSGFNADRNELEDQSTMAIAMLDVLKRPSSVARAQGSVGSGVNDTKTIRQIYAERSSSHLATQYIPIVFIAWAALWLLGTSLLMWFTRHRQQSPLVPTRPHA
jgi:hypothetical protein